jgi:hypothetical protein
VRLNYNKVTHPTTPTGTANLQTPARQLGAKLDWQTPSFSQVGFFGGTGFTQIDLYWGLLVTLRNAGSAGGFPLQAWRLASCNDCQAQLHSTQTQ